MNLLTCNCKLSCSNCVLLLLSTVSGVTRQEVNMARSVPGMDLLRKEMLAYELRVRGETVDGSVAELTARLRGALHKAVDTSSAITGEVADAIASLASAVDQVVNTFSFLDQPTPKQLDRVRAHLNHFWGRIQDLCACELPQGKRAELERLRDTVTAMLLRASSVGLEGDNGSAEEGKESQSDMVDSRREIGIRGMERRESGNQNLITSKFASLPNPLLHLIRDVKEITVDDKSSVRDLLWLLVDLERHALTLSVPHSVVWVLLYPLAKGDLELLLSCALRENWSLRDFRVRLVKQELPDRLCRDLENEYLWRVQQPYESISQYVKRVRTAYLALCPEGSEEKILANVIEGMVPDSRTQLLVLGRPSRWDQLLDKVKQLSSYAYADGQREKDGKRGEQATPTSVLPREATTRDRPRECFRCGAPDHLVRQCPVPREPRKGR